MRFEKLTFRVYHAFASFYYQTLIGVHFEKLAFRVYHAFASFYYQTLTPFVSIKFSLKQRGHTPYERVGRLCCKQILVETKGTDPLRGGEHPLFQQNSC